MTGGQPVDGQLSVEKIARQLHGEGVERIAIVSDDIAKYKPAEFPSFTTIHHRDDLDALQCNLREVKGTSVLIYDQTCAAEKRRRRKRGEMVDPKIRPFINSQVCEGCGDCGIASNCLSVVPEETRYGRKRRIDQSSCNKDMSCIKGFCPSFVTVTGGELRKPVTDPHDFDFSTLPEPDLPAFDIPYGIVIAGVGGTGVTTLGAILGMAAHLEGNGSSVLDMTGLAQKFGAVITHLQIARQPEDIYASRIAAGGARLVIGCDLVVAAANDAMAKVNRGNAYAVINEHESMTAEFTRDPDCNFPAESMHDIITSCVGEKRSHFINSTNAVEQLIGGTMAGNLYLAGFAYQQSLIPITAEAISKAIQLNGASVEENLFAFSLGRLHAFEPDRIQVKPKTVLISESYDDILADRHQFLTRYQNKAYADAYIKRVQQFMQATSAELAEVLAVNYFKVLSYKDEYEVARLFSNEQFKTELQGQFEGDYKLTFHLAPPLLAPVDKHFGQPRKITFGGWMLLAFGLLAKFKFLRGTRFDPFGYTQDRRLERSLVQEYENVINQCEQQYSMENTAIIRQLLQLPQKIRGFGYIKHRNAEFAGREREQLRGQLGAPPEPVKIIDPKAA